MLDLHNDKTLADTLRRRVMNRERRLADNDIGLGLDIVGMAYQLVESQGSFKWYDLCCGYFLAKNDFLNQVHSISDKVEVVGVDLDVRQEGVIDANAVTFSIPEGVNLVTCLYGLDSIQTYLRKGAEAIQNWYNCVGEGAILSFNVEKDSILVQGEDISSYLINELGDDVEVFSTPGNERTHNTFKIIGSDDNIQLPLKRGLY